MAAQRFGGKYSPGGPVAEAGNKRAAPFENRRARKVSIRARLMYLLPVPMFFAGLGAIFRGDPVEMVAEVGGFAGLTFAAYLLNEGLKAEAAFEARRVAKPPSFPRKSVAAVLTGLCVTAVGTLSLGQPLLGALVFGIAAGGAQILAFGLDPMRAKGLDGVDSFESERVARAIDRAEALVREISSAADRIGERAMEDRIQQICGQARGLFRTVEEDPRDLPRARKFLTVYLTGLRDATQKYASLSPQGRDAESRDQFQALLTDLEGSFTAHREDLLRDDRSELDTEIEVLRERLKQDGLVSN